MLSERVNGRVPMLANGRIGRYKDEFLANYGNLHLKSDEKFLLADPRCLVVVGCADQLDDRAKQDSFEHFRRACGASRS